MSLSQPFSAARAHWSQSCWIWSGWSWIWGSHPEHGSQSSMCNQQPQVWPASLHAALLVSSKGIRTLLSHHFPSASPWMRSSMAESAGLPKSSSLGDPALPEAPVPPCQLLVPSPLGELRTKWRGLSSLPSFDSSLPPLFPLCTSSADSEDRIFLEVTLTPARLK